MVALKHAPVASCQDVADVAFAIMYAYHHGTSLRTLKKCLTLDTEPAGLAGILLEFSTPSDGNPKKPIRLELYTEDSNFRIELTEDGWPLFNTADNLLVNVEGLAHKCFKLPPMTITIKGEQLCRFHSSLFDTIKIPLAPTQKKLLFSQILPELPLDSPLLADTNSPQVFLRVDTSFSSPPSTHLRLWVKLPDRTADNTPRAALAYSLVFQPIKLNSGSTAQELEMENHTGLPGLDEFQQFFAGAHSLHTLCTQFPQWGVWVPTADNPTIFEPAPCKQPDILFFLRELYQLQIDFLGRGQPAPHPNQSSNSAFNTILTPCFQALEGQPFSYPLYLQTIQRHCFAQIEAHQLQQLSC